VPDIRHKVVEEDNQYTLLIIETFPADSGRYECVAINSAGEARCEAECFVQGKPGAPKKDAAKPAPAPAKDDKPTLVEPLTDLTVNEGGHVLFQCKIVAPAQPGNYSLNSNILSYSAPSEPCINQRFNTFENTILQNFKPKK